MLISLLNDTNTLKSTDNATTIELAIMNDEQEFVNLSEYKSINISIGKNGMIYSSIIPNILDDNKTMSFTLDGNLSFGKYIVEVNLIKQDDTVQVAPNKGDFPFTIEKSLNEIGETVTVMSVQQLISDMEAVRTLSEDSNTKVTQAVDSANNAVTVANDADTKATQALSNSETAITDSSNALTTANQALTNSQTAIDTSTTANTNSSNALTNSETALTNSQTAITDSANAVTTSTIANTNASEALTKANQAITDSTNARTTANTANTNANTALTNSETAIATANNASSLATTADTNASTALTNSNTAITTANEAKATADGVRADFDQLASGNTDQEVINARTNASGTTFTNVKTRLDDSDSRIVQSLNDSKSYTDTKVASIVNSAPETLNTLNELATALGDDPNFATTVSNEIGTKYTKPVDGIPVTDLSSDVQNALTNSDNANKLGGQLPSYYATAQSVGDLSTLNTTEKGNTVGAINEVGTKLTAHQAEFAKLLTDVDTLKKLRTERSNKDSNGTFTTLTYKRKSDGTIYAKSVLSGGTSPQYTTRTETFYDVDGTTVLASIPYSINYDADGDWVGEV